MALGSFARGALAELGREDLERMLELDETLFVEHKSGLGGDSAYQLAKSVSAFANTLGGWLLLGVAEGQPGAGGSVLGSTDGPTLVDAVRDRLRSEVDPLPAFEARVIELEGGPVGVVRVYESSDTPHVVLSTGAVFVREVAGDADASGPKAAGPGARARRAYRAGQIRSRSQLLELAQRGERAAVRVAELMDPGRPLQLVRDALGLEFDQITRDGWQPKPLDGGAIYVRLAPYTLSDRFRGWATTAGAMTAVLGAAEELARRKGLTTSWANPHPAGVAITVPLEPGTVHSDAAGLGLEATARIVADGAGVVGAALELRPPTDERRRSWVGMDDIAEQLVEPVVRSACLVLEAGEFLGRARCQIDVVALGTAVMLQHTQGLGHYVPTGSDVTLPSDPADVRATVGLAANAVARSGGLPAWDPPRNPH